MSYENPEVDHYTERAWKNIFSVDSKNCYEMKYTLSPLTSTCL